MKTTKPKIEDWGEELFLLSKYYLDDNKEVRLDFNQEELEQFIFKTLFQQKAEIIKDYQVKCGDANPKGNIALNYKGGCGKKGLKTQMYRCVGCGGWFHKECLIEHFKQEENHDWGRQQERKRIIEIIKMTRKKHRCAVCDGAKCEHTLFCKSFSNLIKKLK